MDLFTPAMVQCTGVLLRQHVELELLLFWVVAQCSIGTWAIGPGPCKCSEGLIGGGPCEIRDRFTGVNVVEDVDRGPLACIGLGDAIDRATS